MGNQHEDKLLTDWSQPPPWPVWRLILKIQALLHTLLEKFSMPAAKTMTDVSAFIPAATLMQAAKLGVADLLKDGPKSAVELATALSVNQDNLYRMLRLLVNHGYFEALPSGDGLVLFRNSAFSAVLRSDHPNSVKAYALHYRDNVFGAFDTETMEWHMQQPGNSVTPYQHRYGVGIWDHFRANPAAEATFSHCMTNLVTLGTQTMVADFPWGRFARVIDIGGAHGAVLRAVLTANPELSGVLFEQPEVIKKAREVWRENADWAPVSNRVSFISGDFFKPETLPPAKDEHDLYFMRNIIHDWSDEESVAILKSVRKAIGTTKATLALGELCLIHEFNEHPAFRMRPAVDMVMLALCTGKERNLRQWNSLFEQSGFKLNKLHELRGPPYIIEAEPI